MSEISSLSPQNDILGGDLALDNETWTVKSYEYNASPNGNSDGELRLILSRKPAAPVVVGNGTPLGPWLWILQEPATA